MAHVVTGVRASLDQAEIFQDFVGPQHCRYRHLALGGKTPHGRDPLTGAQGTCGNHPRNRIGDRFVKYGLLCHRGTLLKKGPVGTDTARRAMDHNSFCIGKL